MELGQILMSVNGGERKFAVAELLGGAMKDDLVLTGTIEAKQANIGELNLQDTAEAMTSAKKNATRGSYERSNTKQWGKKKLGAPKQEPRDKPVHTTEIRRKALGYTPSKKTTIHIVRDGEIQAVSDVKEGDRPIRRSDLGSKPSPKTRVTAVKGKSDKCFCKPCRANRNQARIWFENDRKGKHPSKTKVWKECTA
jgi:hypothetical protein